MNGDGMTARTDLPEKVLHRVRVTYRRTEALRYVSTLDMQLVWERMLRRAGVPLAYSQGFNPRPRLHMASALPLGFLSRCEITDFWLQQDGETPAPNPTVLREEIQVSAPPGLEIDRLEFVPLSHPPLQTQVVSAEYLVLPLDPIDPLAVARNIDRLLEAETLPRERRGKPYDLRPLIETLALRPGEPPAIFMRLAAREGATGRPEEVLDAFGWDAASFRVERTALILQPAG